MMTKPQVKTHMYYARILPPSHTYEVCDLVIRTVEDDYFVGVDKRDKHAYLFNYTDLETIVFFDREDALDLVRKHEEVSYE